MGIVDAELAAFSLSEIESCTVEHNANGDVHLHLDSVRVEFTEAEFREFVAVVEEGQAALHDLKRDGPRR